MGFPLWLAPVLRNTEAAHAIGLGKSGWLGRASKSFLKES